MLEVGMKLGGYQILSPLGVGGMGEVYRAHDTKVNQHGPIFGPWTDFPGHSRQSPSRWHSGSAGSFAWDEHYLGRGISFFDQKPTNNYMQRWSFSIQNELPGRFMVEISYPGNRGTKLALSQQYDPIPARYLSTSPARDQATIDYLSTQVLNPFQGMTEFTGTGLAAQRIARSQLLRPYPHLTSISAGVPNGYSWYHSMQLNAEKRMSHGVLFQAAWTWSKLMEATSMLNDSDPLPYETISDPNPTPTSTSFGVVSAERGQGQRQLNMVLKAIFKS